MRLTKSRLTVPAGALFVAGLLSPACNGTSPAEPSETRLETRLHGMVTESPPTQTIPVPQATVQLVGTSLQTQSGADGGYELQNPPSGEVDVRVTRGGFEPAEARLTIAGSTRRDFQLTPALAPVSFTERGTIGPGTPNCFPQSVVSWFVEGSDDLASLPCVGRDVPVHHGGTLKATLSWPGPGDALGLVLLSVADGALAGLAIGSTDPTVTIQVTVEGGRRYVLAVVFNPSWGGPIDYTLEATHPN